METGMTALFQSSAGIPVNTAKTLRVFSSEFLWACAYSAFRSLLQFEKTLQEFGRRKQAESPARKTPDENRRQVRRLKGKLGRGVRGLCSKRLGRAPCACRNKLPTCQIIGSFHQIEEPNKEEKRVHLMTHSVDLGASFRRKTRATSKASASPLCAMKTSRFLAGLLWFCAGSENLLACIRSLQQDSLGSKDSLCPFVSRFHVE